MCFVGLPFAVRGFPCANAMCMDIVFAGAQARGATVEGAAVAESSAPCGRCGVASSVARFVCQRDLAVRALVSFAFNAP